MPSLMEHMADPCYKIFLEHLRKDGNSYTFEMPSANLGTRVVVKYEGPDVPSEQKPSSSGNVKYYHRRKRLSNKSVNARFEAISTVKHEDPFAVQTEEVAKNKLSDDSYEQFLSLLKLEDGLMVLEVEPGLCIRYEHEENNSSESEEDVEIQEQMDIVTFENPLLQTETITREHENFGTHSDNLKSESGLSADEGAIVVSNGTSNLTKIEDDRKASLPIAGPSTFEEKLMAVLNKPYNQDEYEELVRKATTRKPVSRQRVLRGASKRYLTEDLGLSYFDHYPDLALQIDSAEDCHEKLSLLRKLFFWLENLCHPGAYMPWTNKPVICSTHIPDDDCEAMQDSADDTEARAEGFPSSYELQKEL